MTATECGCEHPDILHMGTVPLEICSGCLLRTEPDYLSDNSRLYTLQQSQGVYVPRPRTCGGVEQHYEGKALCTIVGDRPPWWRGHVIDCPRIAPTANRGFRDMLNKMGVIATHPEIQSEFVWMMDDVYLVKPVSLDELQQPRAYGWREDVSNSWQKRKSNTMRILREAGHTNHDYVRAFSAAEQHPALGGAVWQRPQIPPDQARAVFLPSVESCEPARAAATGAAGISLESRGNGLE